MAGGIVVTLVGQPFDTVKVRLQTQPAGKTIYSTPSMSVRKFDDTPYDFCLALTVSLTVGLIQQPTANGWLPCAQLDLSTV